MSTLLNARHYYTPFSCTCVASNQSAWIQGPTIVKPVLCLKSGQGAWALEDFRQGLHCLVEVPPLLPSLYKSPEPPVTSGEVGWTAGSTHLHHALGTSQVRAHTLIHALAGEVQTPIALLEL